MKMNNILIALVAAIVIPIAVFSLLGIEITPILVFFLKYAIPIAIIGYLLIAARCCLVKMQDSKTSTDLNVKMEMLKESMDKIEKKVDKIDRILEKVSE